jgi:hypothetical protein
MENIEIEDSSSAAWWQPPVDPEPVKENECSDTDIHPIPGSFLGNSILKGK